LKRLEHAGIISIDFHGSKKPLQINFNPEIAILFDAKDRYFVPKSEHFNEQQAKSSLDKFFNRKPSEPCFYEEYTPKHDTNNVFPVQYLNNNITITENSVLHAQNIDYYLNNNTEENKAESQNTDTLKTKESTHESNPDVEEKKEKSSAKKEKKNISRNETVRLQTIWTYAMLFYAYIVDNLFFDKKDELTDWYKAETIQYIAQNYFSMATSGEHVSRLWEFLYKPRIDLAKKEIDKFPMKYNREFNRDKFYPKAYLDISKKGKLHYSYANTYDFMRKQKEWNSLNFWNRKLDDNVMAMKFFRILRDIENQKYDYETAIEKVRSINMDTNIFSIMLNASFTGKMFDMNVRKNNNN
jgi:hypothetical protein